MIAQGAKYDNTRDKIWLSKEENNDSMGKISSGWIRFLVGKICISTGQMNANYTDFAKLITLETIMKNGIEEHNLKSLYS